MRFKSRPEHFSRLRPGPVEPLERLGTRAVIDNALPDPGEKSWVGDVGKMADQRAVGRDYRPGRLYDQTLPCQSAVP